MLQFPAKTSVSQQIKMAEGGSGNLRPGASRSKRKGRSRRGKKTNHRWFSVTRFDYNRD